MWRKLAAVIIVQVFFFNGMVLPVSEADSLRREQVKRGERARSLVRYGWKEGELSGLIEAGRNGDISGLAERYRYLVSKYAHMVKELAEFILWEFNGIEIDLPYERLYREIYIALKTALKRVYCYDYSNRTFEVRMVGILEKQIIPQVLRMVEHIYIPQWHVLFRVFRGLKVSWLSKLNYDEREDFKEMIKSKGVGLGAGKDYYGGDIQDIAEFWCLELFAKIPAPGQALEDREIWLEDKLPKVLERLDVKERKVLWMYYAEDFTLEEIGGKSGFTRERARQIRNEALKKLRRYLTEITVFQKRYNRKSSAISYSI